MIRQKPTLTQLVDFERASWPKHEQTTLEELEKRLATFPEGIFILTENGVDVAQVTISPKPIVLKNVTSFEAMRDLPVKPKSKSLWITNIAVRKGKEYRGNGYGRTLLTHVVAWAKAEGYHLIAAGVTCPGYSEALRKGEVQSIHDYLAQNKNSALRTFQSAAKANGCKFWHSTPLENYWPIDKDSAGYGVLTVINLT